jgi:polysaccharide export outer membrane protein
MMIRWLKLLWVCAVPLAARVAPAQELTYQPPVLKPGDVIKITVWRRPEFTGEFVIGSDSSIQHPLYQSVKAAGVAMPEVKARLQQYLTQYETNPQFVIEPLFKVAVGGEVRSPNLYALPRETTIAQAVSLAGGPSERGRLDRVRLVRGGQTLRLDLTRSDEPWAQEPIRSGDQIMLGRRRNYLTEYIGPLASVVSVIVSIISLSR